MLATNAHGGYGGIAKYNRDVIEAMSHFDRITGIVVLPRIVSEPEFETPSKTHYDLRGLSGPVHYVFSCMTGKAQGHIEPRMSRTSSNR